MDFSDKELEKLKMLADIYIQAKGIIIFSEEINPESKSNLQTIKELRDGFDHLIRVIHTKIHKKSEKNDDYSYLNIDKALGHTYRAAFDAADGCALSLKENILDLLNGFPPDIIIQVIPKYFDYKKDIYNISEKVANHRSKKDSGDFSKDVLSQYIEELENLKKIHHVFQTNIKDVVELQTSIKNRENKTLKKHILIGVVIALIFLILGFILTVILKHRFHIDL